jgi:hypothetical protein
MAAKRWTMIGVHSGYERIKSAWQNSRDSFAKPGEEMIFKGCQEIYTNMPQKHLRALLRYADATVDIMVWAEEADARDVRPLL